MKKKQQNISKSISELDLKSLIHDHSLFFDSLVELIPARFYLPVDDQKPWFQGLSKVAKASAKKETRQKIKESRRARLDPEKASTTLDLLQKNIDEEKKKEEESDEEVEFEMADMKETETETKVAAEVKNKSVTYEELRERLHRKIEELRLSRHADEEKPRFERRREIREGKRKRNPEDDNEKVKQKEKDLEKEKEKEKEGEKIEEEVTRATERLAFSHVKIGSEDELGRKRKKKKLSKAQALEEAKKLDEMKKDPEQGKKFSWQAAADRASGVKVHDDPKLIKKSIKKDQKKHEKNVGKWKERIESRDKVRIEKQQKRSGNIAERIKDKKMRKIAKREKKLMRPGFEGRKEGFIKKS